MITMNTRWRMNTKWILASQIVNHYMAIYKIDSMERWEYENRISKLMRKYNKKELEKIVASF